MPLKNKCLNLLTFGIVMGFFSIILFEYILKKWSCVEGRCERIIGSGYNTFGECKKNCPEKYKFFGKFIDRRRRGGYYGSSANVGSINVGSINEGSINEGSISADIDIFGSKISELGLA